MRGLICAIVLFTPIIAFASDVTIGPNGINSVGLKDINGRQLTGAGVSIGQVEVGRPAKEDVDDNANPAVLPYAVYARNSPPGLIDPDGHAEEVASVMISIDSTGARGVAYESRLYSNAFGKTFNVVADFDAYAAIAAQYLATLPDANIRAINMSMGLFAQNDNPGTDGQQLFTQFIDWSAHQDNMLYVVAGNQNDPAATPVGPDNFNGMTIARSTIDANGVYRIVDSGNRYFFDAAGDRTSISLVAPGVNLDVNKLGSGQVNDTGTSFAAPHVTGTVALLQQYATQRINQNAPRWNVDSPRQHTVMKAVLMNSADK